MDVIRWGVLGAARIATAKVIPAMQRGQWSTVTAIASRDLRKAQSAATALDIPRAYGSYEELLADPDVDAVYNPLPNHLHVPWSLRAAAHGKHVLCEKPIALSAAEARQLVEARDRTGVRIQEAFMVRTHPQWQKARELVASGTLGVVRSIAGYFSYYNDAPENIRNVPEFGGGGLMDIGCYLVNTARFLFGREPHRVFGAVDRDPRLHVDRLTSILLDFGGAHAIGTCSTQLTPYQQVHVVGTAGRLELAIPFNAPPDRPSRMTLQRRTDHGAAAETATIELPVCDQFTIQADLFSRAILDGTPQPVPLEDAVNNMACIDAVFRSADSGHWEAPITIPLIA